ncbi:MAG: hypothetical protein M3Z06_01225 [Actinomycetota bacterium]|nr:hypothetical protein [Actinomycetota bacterium]
MRKLRQAPHATVIAFIALVVAISGVAVAAPSPKAHTASAQRGPRGLRGPRGPAGVVPQIITVDSPKESLPNRTSTYQVDPNGFLANCPSGYTVLGTGFSAQAVATVGLVVSYGSFVGGFISNTSGIPLQGIYLQAICGRVPHGSKGAHAADIPSAMATYQAQARQMQAAFAKRQ